MTGVCFLPAVGQVQAAGSVLVVGGGSTGVEMAAEIKTEYPDKKVIISYIPLLFTPLRDLWLEHN